MNTKKGLNKITAFFIMKKKKSQPKHILTPEQVAKYLKAEKELIETSFRTLTVPPEYKERLFTSKVNKTVKMFFLKQTDIFEISEKYETPKKPPKRKRKRHS